MIKRKYLNDKQNPANIIYPITDEQSVRDGNGVTLATKLSDLPQVREGAALGRTAYQKPVTGIPASDIAEGVIPDVTNFVTRSVNDLVNYYTKSQTYTKEEVANLIAAIQQFHYEVVVSTSAVTSPSNNVLYLVGPTGSGSDKYEEYVYDSTKDNPWIKIGDTSIDLSGYVTTQSLNTILSNYVTSSDLVSALSSKQDTLVSGTNIKTVNGENILGSGNITAGDPNAVKYTEQTLTSAQQAQARTNIGATAPEILWVTYGSQNFEEIIAAVDEQHKLPAIKYQDIVYVYSGRNSEELFFTSVNSTTVKTITADYGGGEVIWNIITVTSYTKPSGGIPSTDLSSDVQTSLGKADTALQSFTETDPTVPSWAKAQNPPQDIFWAIYGTTTGSEIQTAVDSGKLVLVKTDDSDNEVGMLSYYDSPYYSFIVPYYNGLVRYQLSNNVWSKEYVELQKTSNLVTSWNTTLSDLKYPSEKLVKNSLNEKYVKPTSGIPASDLASAVRTSLGKADTALQSFTETDPTVPAWAKAQNPPQEVFMAEYGVTTYQQVYDAFTAGKLIVVKKDNRIIPLDRIITASNVFYFVSSVWFGTSIAFQLGPSGTWGAYSTFSMELSSNKKTSISGNESSDTYYPTAKAVADYVASKELSDLADVSDTAPTDGQALLWDGTDGEWKPGTVQGSGGSVTDVTVGGTSVVNQQGVAEVPAIPETVQAQEIEIDNTPTANSNNLVTSGGVYAVLGDIETLINAL